MKRKPLLATKRDCTGCMVCVDVCPTKALSSTIASDGHIYTVCNNELCIECGKCSKVCPVIAKFDYVSFAKRSEPFAAWTDDNNIRIDSASGGVFAAIAKYVIQLGGCVFGASISKLEVKHIMIDNLLDLYKLQGAKYQQGDLSGIYKQVKKKLDDKYIVLFSGAPCQVAALFSFLGNRKYENLITMDFICSGFPSLLPLRQIVRMDHIDEIISFRDKKNGWRSQGYKVNFVIKNADVIHEYGYNNIVTLSFASSLTHRYSCCNCHFCLLYRKADFTVGDFWGDKQFTEQHEKGLSVMILHSSKAKNIVLASGLKSREITWSDFVYNNPRYLYGHKYHILIHPIRHMLPYIYEWFSVCYLKNIYNGNKRKLWLFYKLGNVLIHKINDQIAYLRIKWILRRNEY